MAGGSFNVEEGMEELVQLGKYSRETVELPGFVMREYKVSPRRSDSEKVAGWFSDPMFPRDCPVTGPGISPGKFNLTKTLFDAL
jgi:hypothetical protein